VYRAPEEIEEEKRKVEEINIFSYTYLFYMAKIAALILFFLNKIVNELFYI